MKVILPETDITVASLNSLRDLALLVDFIFLFLRSVPNTFTSIIGVQKAET